jgi:uncharacterized protein YuzE
MKIEYFADTDSLYIDLSGRKGMDAVELAEGVVMDVDSEGRPVGLDIDQASKHLDLNRLEFSHLPFQVHQVA